MKVKVKIDERLCIGSGNCILIASKHFRLNSQNQSEVITPGKKRAKQNGFVELEVEAKDREKLLTAARSCPAQAIIIVDEKGKELSA